MEIEFMIKSEVLQKLTPSINDAVKLIKSYIEGKHPILLRHHSDADGYCGALALERAILPKILDAHTKEREAFYTYARKPSLTPWYDYEDALKDLSYFLSSKGKYEYKKPLVIIVDNGSSVQDTLALKTLKIYGVKVIIIDHHPVSDEVKDYCDVLVNPHLAGSSYDFSAGMLCAEIARIINPKANDSEFIAAVSACADRVKSREKDEYLKCAQKEGYTEGFIETAAEVIDFEAQNLGFIEARQIVDDLFGADREKQRKIFGILKEEVDKKRQEALFSAKKYSHISRMPKMNLVIIPVGSLVFRGDFPPPGKIVGMMNDYISKTEEKPTVSLGIMDGMITLRGTPDSGIDVNKIISDAKQKMPYAQINGGGHAKAGSIKFIPAAHEEVKEFVLAAVRK